MKKCRVHGRMMDGFVHGGFIYREFSANPLMRSKIMRARFPSRRIKRREGASADVLRNAETC